MRPHEEQPLILSTDRVKWLRKAIRPLRRFFAWFTLVYEERYWRITSDMELEEAHRETRAIVDWTTQQLEKFAAEIERISSVTEGLTAGLEARLIERTDLLLEELWRRSEIGLANQARDVQKLQEQAQRLAHENAAILRLLSATDGEAVEAQHSHARATVAVSPPGAEVAQNGPVSQQGTRALAAPDKTVATVMSGNGSEPPLGGGNSGDGKAGDGAVSTPTPPTFEEFFHEAERGPRQDVRDKVHRYLRYFRSDGPVVDLGCGRGEFVELLAWGGIPAYGVDIDPAAVRRCHDLGLDARQEDLFEHLRGLPDATLGGVFSAQVVEHLPPHSIWPLFKEIARVLRPGAKAVIETPNPASFATHMHSFWRDPDHVRPLPAPTLSMAARAAGLLVEDIVYQSPPPEEERLQVSGSESFDPPLRDLARAFDRAVNQLNTVIYGPQDYAVVAVKPA
jgi:SAM-dependent methyltransferase